MMIFGQSFIEILNSEMVLVICSTLTLSFNLTEAKTKRHNTKSLCRLTKLETVEFGLKYETQNEKCSGVATFRLFELDIIKLITITNDDFFHPTGRKEPPLKFFGLKRSVYLLWFQSREEKAMHIT